MVLNGALFHPMGQASLRRPLAVSVSGSDTQVQHWRATWTIWQTAALECAKFACSGLISHHKFNVPLFSKLLQKLETAVMSSSFVTLKLELWGGPEFWRNSFWWHHAVDLGGDTELMWEHWADVSLTITLTLHTFPPFDWPHIGFIYSFKRLVSTVADILLYNQDL